jgi:hypothetical protein
LVVDATGASPGLTVRQIVRTHLTRARLLALPLAAIVLLVLAPALPVPSSDFPTSPLVATEKPPERGDVAMMQEASGSSQDALKRPSFEERDLIQRSGTGGSTTAGDLSAIFKDTSLGNARPDFNSFLKKGDERLKMLEQVDRLPDLQSDFTSSQYKVVYRRAKELRGGLSPDISPQKLKELLEEMERLGRKGGNNWSPDAAEGLEALEGGQSDRAMQAMEKALNKMRAMDEQGRGGKNLRGGREGTERTGPRRGGRRARRAGFREGEGSCPARARALPKGEATSAPRQSVRRGRGGESAAAEGRFDTNMVGRGVRCRRGCNTSGSSGSIAR